MSKNSENSENSEIDKKICIIGDLVRFMKDKKFPNDMIQKELEKLKNLKDTRASNANITNVPDNDQ
jgi:hypothetical protein